MMAIAASGHDCVDPPRHPAPDFASLSPETRRPTDSRDHGFRL